jgi:hypothetical protein
MAKVPLIPAWMRDPWPVGDQVDAAAGGVYAEGIFQIALDPDDEDVDIDAEALADIWNGHVTPLEEVMRRFELEARARKRKFVRRQRAMEKARQRAGTATTAGLEWGYRPRLGEGLRVSNP